MSGGVQHSRRVEVEPPFMLRARLLSLSRKVIDFSFNGVDYCGMSQTDWLELCERGAIEEDLRESVAGRLASQGEMFVIFGERADLPAMADRSIAQRLTPRELKVACLIAEGLTDKEISRQLGISAYTVREHCRRACAKLNISKRSALVRSLYAARLPE
jgi:DNA-binding CsgD family transcriptional regulator